MGGEAASRCNRVSRARSAGGAAVAGGRWYGEHSIQGDTWDTRHRAGEWVLYDHTGAVLSPRAVRFKVAADDDLLTISIRGWMPT